MAKLNASGTALIYSTYLGGSGNDQSTSIAVDSSGDAYVAGLTGSPDFPVTPGAFQTSLHGGSNFFATKLNAIGNALIYSTYIGGSRNDQGLGIAVDSSGNAYVVGLTGSPDFPVTPGAFQTTLRGSEDNSAITKLNATGTALVYSTYLGGSLYEAATSIAVDASGNAYVAGDTASGDFPTTPGAFQTSLSYQGIGFVTKLNATGTALLYSTYLGGNDATEASSVAINSSGNAYVTGATRATNFPTTTGAFQTTFGGNDNPGGPGDAYITKLNASGAGLIYSTYLGGSGADAGTSIALDSSGDAYVVGYTDSTNFPTANAFQPSNGGSLDAFVTEMNPNGSALVNSSYLGGGTNDSGYGVALDSLGGLYATGYTGGDFPTTPSAFQSTYGGGSQDAFVAKVSFGPPCTVTYNGTFNGNLNITSGLTCIINGTVTGNLTENGGGLYTSNATIGGNLQITGGGTFSMASTDVNGDLQIQNIPTGSAQNQICGTHVKGNLTFHNNGTAVEIGTTSASCPGDTIGNDLQVNNNTAAVEVFDDSAGGNLQCQNNSSITGSGDTAKSLQGQCAGF